MRPAVKQRGAATQPVPNPDVMRGDEVYFQHADGPQCGKVLATGQHGITVHHAGKPTCVHWHHVLGHKKRAAQKYSVLEEGEDGLIVQDGAGQRRYVTVPPEARGEAMVLGKSLRERIHDGGARFVTFAKAGPIANAPGLSLQQKTDKNGKASRHWVRTNKELPLVQHGGAPDQPDGHGPHRIKPGDKVSFSNGEHAGSGVVHTAGQHGAVIHDAAGGEHRVRHEFINPPKKEDDVDKFSAADFAKQHDDAAATPDSIIDSFGPDAKGRVQAARERLTTARGTDEQYAGAGGWTDERRALHHKVIFDGVEINGKKVPGLLSPERVKAAIPPPGQQPTFVALGGRGGSGKSSLNGSVYEEARAIVVDADHIKGMLPEYAGWNAHAVHEESGHILESVLEIAKLLGVNVVLDATMKTGKSLDDKIDAFKAAGFRTEAHYMHLPRQEAAKRAVGRFINGGENGRFVPPEVVLGNDRNEENFDKIKSRVDAWSFHDNNRPKEEGPKLIAQKGTPALSSKKIMTKSVRTDTIILWNLMRRPA